VSTFLTDEIAIVILRQVFVVVAAMVAVVNLAEDVKRTKSTTIT
jgi:hypothetical protein